MKNLTFTCEVPPWPEETTPLNRNLKSEQLILHSLLNLLQSFNAKWVLITGWDSGGRPQSAASGDTPMHRGSTSASITLNTCRLQGISQFIAVYYSPVNIWQSLPEQWESSVLLRRFFPSKLDFPELHWRKSGFFQSTSWCPPPACSSLK